MSLWYLVSITRRVFIRKAFVLDHRIGHNVSCVKETDILMAKIMIGIESFFCYWSLATRLWNKNMVLSHLHRSKIDHRQYRQWWWWSSNRDRKNRSFFSKEIKNIFQDDNDSCLRVSDQMLRKKRGREFGALSVVGKREILPKKFWGDECSARHHQPLHQTLKASWRKAWAECCTNTRNKMGKWVTFGANNIVLKEQIGVSQISMSYVWMSQV